MRAFYCCALCILVIDAEKIDRSWSTYTLSRRSKWRRWTRSPKEKQRLGEALARLDAQRGKLVSQLSELEATEHVLARYSTAMRARKTSSAKMPTTGAKAASLARLRRRFFHPSRAREDG